MINILVVINRRYANRVMINYSGCFEGETQVLKMEKEEKNGCCYVVYVFGLVCC